MLKKTPIHGLLTGRNSHLVILCINVSDVKLVLLILNKSAEKCFKPVPLSETISLGILLLAVNHKKHPANASAEQSSAISR